VIFTMSCNTYATYTYFAPMVLSHEYHTLVTSGIFYLIWYTKNYNIKLMIYDTVSSILIPFMLRYGTPIIKKSKVQIINL
jgi:hypothetical protein